MTVVAANSRDKERKKKKKTNQLSFDLSSTVNNQHFVYLVKKIGAVQSMVNVMVYEYLSIYLVSIIHAFIIFLYNLIWFFTSKSSGNNQWEHQTDICIDFN